MDPEPNGFVTTNNRIAAALHAPYLEELQEVHRLKFKERAECHMRWRRVFLDVLARYRSNHPDGEYSRPQSAYDEFLKSGYIPSAIDYGFYFRNQDNPDVMANSVIQCYVNEYNRYIGILCLSALVHPAAAKTCGVWNSEGSATFLTFGDTDGWRMDNNPLVMLWPKSLIHHLWLPCLFPVPLDSMAPSPATVRSSLCRDIVDTLMDMMTCWIVLRFAPRFFIRSHGDTISGYSYNVETCKWEVDQVPEFLDDRLLRPCAQFDSGEAHVQVVDLDCEDMALESAESPGRSKDIEEVLLRSSSVVSENEWENELRREAGDDFRFIVDPTGLVHPEIKEETIRAYQEGRFRLRDSDRNGVSAVDALYQAMASFYTEKANEAQDQLETAISEMEAAQMKLDTARHTCAAAKGVSADMARNVYPHVDLQANFLRRMNALDLCKGENANTANHLMHSMYNAKMRLHEFLQAATEGLSADAERQVFVKNLHLICRTLVPRMIQWRLLATHRAGWSLKDLANSPAPLEGLEAEYQQECLAAWSEVADRLYSMVKKAVVNTAMKRRRLQLGIFSDMRESQTAFLYFLRTDVQARYSYLCQTATPLLNHYWGCDYEHTYRPSPFVQKPVPIPVDPTKVSSIQRSSILAALGPFYNKRLPAFAVSRALREAEGHEDGASASRRTSIPYFQYSDVKKFSESELSQSAWRAFIAGTYIPKLALLRLALPCPGQRETNTEQ